MKVIYILLLAILSLVVGLLTGLVRMGWAMPVAEAAGQHGALMVGSFLGTLILLERAAVFRNRWVLVAPLANALSLPAFWSGFPQVGMGLLLAGGLSMTAMTYWFLMQYKHRYYYLLVGGSVCLVVGDILLLRTGFYPMVVPWWMAFLLLTIVGERLELSRFLPVMPRQRAWLWGAVALFLAGVAQPFHGFGQTLMGVGMLAVAAWLARFDMARRSYHRVGQTGYTSTVLLLGYGWLAVSGLLFLLPIRNAFWYDAALHSFFLGFVFSMIFAHAPIILPGVLGRSGVFYSPVLYGWAMLHSVVLALRLWADWQQRIDWRMHSGLWQAVVLAGFGLTILMISIKKCLKHVNSRTSQSTRLSL